MGFFSKIFGRGRENPRGVQADCGAPFAPRSDASGPGAEPEVTIPWAELTPAQCQEKIAAGGAIVLDVRMPHEHALRRIDGSLLIPLQRLQERILQLDKGAVYVVHCEHGMRSADACYYLKLNGFVHIYEMAGGLSAYAGPTVRGPVQ